MKDRDVVKQALYDAIQWEESLADVNAHCDKKVTKECLWLAKQYRRILKNRYGDSRTPMEKILEGATFVTLDQIKETK